MAATPRLAREDLFGPLPAGFVPVPRDDPGALRTAVGDRYVLEEMRKTGCNVGGEQSGHIILADHATTGDGLVAGLQVLASLVEAKAPASELLRQFEPLPQLLLFLSPFVQHRLRHGISQPEGDCIDAT